MKRIVLISIMMMAMASLRAQSIYVEPTSAFSEPMVCLIGDSLSVSWFSDDPITELRYKCCDSVDWTKQMPTQPTHHYTLTIPMSEAGQKLEYVLVCGNHYQAYSVCDEVIIPKKMHVEYGYRTDNRRHHPMW